MQNLSCKIACKKIIAQESFEYILIGWLASIYSPHTLFGANVVDCSVLHIHSVGSLRILFRSSPANRFRGFEAVITCIEPQVLDDADCSDPTTTTGSLVDTRGKRDLEIFVSLCYSYFTGMDSY